MQESEVLSDGFSMYCTRIRLVLDYAASIWRDRNTAYLQHEQQRVQNRCQGMGGLPRDMLTSLEAVPRKSFQEYLVFLTESLSQIQ